MSIESPVVEEVRERHREISTHFDGDLQKYEADLREIKAAYRHRVMNRIAVVPTAPADASAGERESSPPLSAPHSSPGNGMSDNPSRE